MTQASKTKIFHEMSDEEIIQHCKDICNKHCLKDPSTKEIKEWCGITPAISFTHHGRLFMFMGMIFSPTGKVLSF